jgi:hypothetical protein
LQGENKGNNPISKSSLAYLDHIPPVGFRGKSSKVKGGDPSESLTSCCIPLEGRKGMEGEKGERDREKRKTKEKRMKDSLSVQ